MEMEIISFEKELEQSKEVSTVITKCISNNVGTQENCVRFKNNSNKSFLDQNPEELNLQMFANNNQKSVFKFEAISREQKSLLKEMDCLNRKVKDLELEINSLKQEKTALSNSRKVTRRALQTAISKYKQIFIIHVDSVVELSAATFKINVQFANNQCKGAAMNVVVDRTRRQIIDFEDVPAWPLTDQKSAILKKYLMESSKNNCGVFANFLRDLLLRK